MSIPTCCPNLEQNIHGEDKNIVFAAKFREYGIPVLDGGSSYILIGFCPWCGAKLSKSLRDDWFAAIVRLGIDPHDGPIPEMYTDERWYASLTDDANL